MLSAFESLSDWVIAFADSDWSALALAVTAFTESIFFPVPPDLLLIGISLRQPEMALWLAALATVSSVAGAVVGHWLGHRIGRPVLHRLVSEAKVAGVERMFSKYGAWAILVAAFTPIPYKVFTITAGILNLDRRTFVIASLVGRGGRFFAQGALLFVYGDSIEEFIDANFQYLTVASGVALVVAVVAVAMITRWRRARKAIG